MSDTPAHIEKQYREMIMARSVSERLAMASRMFAAAKALAIAGIRYEMPEANPEVITRRLLLRFYGDDLSHDLRRMIRLRDLEPNPPAPENE